MKHGTLAAFEEKRGLPTGSVRDVLRGRSNARVENAIASDIKAPLHKVFPRRYGLGSTSTNVDDSNRKRDTHGLTGEAR